MLKEKKISMKEILFPEREKIKMNFEHHKRNLRFIKDLEKNNKEEKKIKEENEKLNEFNENYNENFNENSNENNENSNENKKNLFKMKMFENVPARYLKNTENWILNHNKMNKKLPQIKKLNLIHSKKKYNLNYKNKTLENKNNFNNNNNESLFEKYYVKMLKKNIHSNSQENLFYSQPIINNINSYAKKNKNYLPPIINIF